MDEVEAMSRAGENMGKAVGTGVRNARHGAARASKKGTEITRQAILLAEQELASRGVSTEDLQERLAQRATGMSRKELAKRGKKARKQWEKKSARSRKQLAKNAEAARKELAGRIEPAPKSRRKWPWVLLALAGLAAAAAVALSRRPEELPVVDAEHDRFPAQDSEGKSTNGSEAHTDGQVSGTPTALDSDKER
ncbi:hypothetical protein FHX42_005149 [Saccharopolyspora lacisalsi]|uniref:Uncharacterized protein n=1 Tax=Halosaccharopolyspora lacisalsi TaxID=1000566 RepID=A0A839E1N7_9PSEU|nr:hypothetical protein [Halosaccharopolyspora lacisalsi]MBA8827744.1 hypothetical protein [Halosaccharopolyspora lacisalsi]